MRVTTRWRLLASVFTGLIITAMPQESAAQETQSAPSGTAPITPDAASNEVPDIIVTAQRRAQRLQDVPVTITAFGGDQLQRAGATRADDIATLTPGLTVGSFTPSRPQVFIRGIGTRQIDIGSDPSIGVFVDDVYVSRVSGQMTGLADLERVEVLKGPQGTLYGRNTIGGAINIITRAPSRELSAFADIGIGDYNYFDARGSLSGPLINDLAYGRVSFFRTKRDGYVRNLATGGRAQGIDQYDVRGKLLLTRDGPLSATFTVDVLRDRSPGQEGKSAGPDVILRSPFVPVPVLSNDPLAERYNVESLTQQNINQYIGRIDWRQGIHIASISAYRTSTLLNDGETDYTILDIARQTTNESSREFSQELRVASIDGEALTFGDKLSWVAGIYYLRDSAKRSDLFTFGKDSLPVLVANFFGVPLTSIGNTTTLDRVATSYAAFAEVTWKIIPNLDIITGGRFSWDRKEGRYIGETTASGFPVLTTPFNIPLSRRWNAFNPRVTVAWHAAKDTLFFATYSQGFKSGGFQFAVSDPLLAARIFDPETVKFYEGGVKSTLLDRKLQIGASVFHYKYGNLQTQRTVLNAGGSPTSIVENAASSTINGGEVNLVLAPRRDLTINMGVTLLDAKYDSYNVGGGTNFSGTRLLRAPRFSNNVALDYTPTLSQDVRLIAHADWYHSSAFYFEPGETRISVNNQQNAYDLVNLRLGVEWRQWSLTGFVTNVFDKRYRAANDIVPGITTAFGTTGLQSRAYYAAPRMIGARMSWKL